MSGKKQIRIRDLFFNVQMICVFIGLFLLFTGIRLPQIVRSSMETVTSSMAAVSMLIIGMVVSSVSWKEIFRYKRVWVIAALRLLACPLAAVLLFRLTGLGHFAAEGSTILTICVLSTASPSANMVVTMAQLFHQDEKYAGVINVVTVLLCVITMPAMLAVCVSLFR